MGSHWRTVSIDSDFGIKSRTGFGLWLGTAVFRGKFVPIPRTCKIPRERRHFAESGKITRLDSECRCPAKNCGPYLWADYSRVRCSSLAKWKQKHKSKDHEFCCRFWKREANDPGLSKLVKLAKHIINYLVFIAIISGFRVSTDHSKRSGLQSNCSDPASQCCTT